MALRIIHTRDTLCTFRVREEKVRKVSLYGGVVERKRNDTFFSNYVDV